MERYETYKDSGIEWIGEIPTGWEIKKLKHLIKNLESGVSVNSTDFPTSNGSYGILKTSCVYNYFFDPKENKEIWQSELMRAKINPRKGELIISRMNTPELVGASGYVENNHGNLFLPDRLWQTKFHEHVTLDTKWLSFVAKSLPFRKLLSILATGTSPSMKNLAQEDFLNINIPFPRHKEQTAIANYLDHKTAEIDALIAQKQRLIELYQEEKTTIINQAVTQGIDRSASVQDSGIDWLGGIPDGWKIKKLKYVADARPSNIDKKSKDEEEAVLLCNYVDVYKNEFISSDLVFMVATANQEQKEKFLLQKGDVLATKDSETADDIAIPALVVEDFDNVVCGYHLTHIKPKKILGSYLFRYFQTKYLSSYFEVSANGVTRYGLGVDKFGSALILNPPLEEQTAIVQHIEIEAARIDAKIAKTKRIIELQKEYRTALISEVVTGKIKVSHLADKEMAL